MSVEVKFVWLHPANVVNIAGTFSNWDHIPLKKVNSHFECSIPLSPSTYYYKFIVDGVWKFNPTLPHEDDNYGGMNNILIVGSGGNNSNSGTQPAAAKAAHNQPAGGKNKKPTSVQPKVTKIGEIDLPQYWETRVALWDKIKKRRESEYNPSRAPITITLPDNSTKEGKAGVTTPMDIANSISSGLANSALVAVVNGKPWDLNRPIEEDCSLEIKKFDSPEGNKVFWHSSAHIMGQALERIFHCSLCIGPPLENGGFYYDMSAVGSDGNLVTFAEHHSELVAEVVKKIIKEKQPFERIVLEKQEALEMFSYNKYKVQLINEKVPDGETCTAYRCGPLIDLCKGPHIPHTGKIHTFEVWKNASAYWKGNAENDSLQRIYGMTFPNADLYKKWKEDMEMRKLRDHRLQGVKQELFFFHDLSPGCPLILPRGTKVYNKLQQFIRGEYRKRGFTEVITPNFYNADLWKTSGHWAHYKDDMFVFQIEGKDFALKPMNCPGHCLMYRDFGKHSYKELPIRYADFGVLHRNELTGALSGLTRVRRFLQDDAHIFCRADQIASEIKGCFDFLKFVYDIFGWEFTLELSTRPLKKFIGDEETWNNAEKQLAECLTEFVGEKGWKLNPGDGAFYGPKIDIHVFDALKREHQCATIQLDFNLPKNFELTYISEDNSEVRPVMIHRAVLGSFERFIAILVENTVHSWPFWLSPRPCIICTVSQKQEDYARLVYQRIFSEGFDADLDLSDHKIAKKVLEAQVAGYNYILVVGQSEADKNTVNHRFKNEMVEKSLDDLLKEWADLTKNYK